MLDTKKTKKKTTKKQKQKQKNETKQFIMFKTWPICVCVLIWRYHFFLRPTKKKKVHGTDSYGAVKEWWVSNIVF